MMSRQILLAALASVASLVLWGCDLPGRPAAGPEVPRPQEVMAFDPLYKQNCAGCHGTNGENGAAVDLANPEYEGWIDDASLRGVIAQGERASLMPAFALKSGGTLTDAQIDVLVKGMRSKWAKQNVLAGLSPPSYFAARPGVATEGEAVYVKACARCHGTSPQHPGSAGSILDPSFLALMNAQTLRTTIVAGRPDLGQPDWRNDVPGHELTDSEIANVIAWLTAQTPVSSTSARVDSVPDLGRSSVSKPLTR